MKKLSLRSKGVMYGLSAYIFWGFLPFYWKLLSNADSLHILSARIIFSFLFLASLLLAQNNIRWILCFKNGRIFLKIMVLAVLITANWGIYIWAVNKGHIIEASLGYFINPILSIVLGLIFLREKMKTMQWAAFIFASIGVVLITLFSGEVPIISLSLALTFSFYGLIKKKLRLSALESLTAETLAALPIAVCLIFVSQRGTQYLLALPAYTYVLLIFGGAVTAFPLFLFAKSAKLLPLSTVGFIQFINPLMQFIFAIFIFRENFPLQNFMAIIFIWLGALLYPLSYVKHRKKKACEAVI
ncbi:MAG: EamA family transporter RarD [Endomicrobium sp.]|jgi:chloramphenicol-sensitive protein RarD|nr:EamA family transporter RarD [Endomicrobium sp.]